ncbi:MAG: ABC transporter permease [Chloroflexi bacterium]|jgi:ABC-type dipeptide/oligopeptide/nickel transport system permease subunit|nr:ABC transporter permease [Anaerolineaceae bacterium]NLI44092.1 ABC transporter permease [Chloroflexota bacterium]HOE35501.1 ABC transporter permease [Anaerolineaceae bacterium]HOT26163.1 ABC transporter permease [Anaerolineaceae bacterium]HQH58510.1 ABC transporter permease [Anaerolineaceae bacterium]
MSTQLPEVEVLTDFAVREHRSLWLDAWRRLKASRTAMLGLVIVAVFLLSAVGAHFFWNYDPKMDLDYNAKLRAPNLVSTPEKPTIHIFGTDKLGRDIFTRVVHGGWNSLRVGLVAVGISLIIGCLLGLFAGFFESFDMNFKEKLVLMSGLGLALGLLPAWIARQWFQVLLFGGLGAASVLLEKKLAHFKLTRLLFALAGMLLGGVSGLLVAPLVGLVCAVVGLMIGILLAKPVNGKAFSSITMRIMDIILSFPSYLLAIAIVAFLGPGLEKGMIAIGVVGIPIYARLARSAVLSVSQKEYVLASQSVGEGHGRILFKHVLPNILSPIIVQATMGLASAILSAAALGFLGLGAIPPEPEWGAMLGDSYKFLSSGAWWAVLFPGLAIVFSVLGFNLLGDGLRDALDPKMRAK